jgi:hypothetical protein
VGCGSSSRVCLASAKPWIQTPTLPKKKKRERERLGSKELLFQVIDPGLVLTYVHHESAGIHLAWLHRKADLGAPLNSSQLPETPLTRKTALLATGLYFLFVIFTVLMIKLRASHRQGKASALPLYTPALSQFFNSNKTVQKITFMKTSFNDLEDSNTYNQILKNSVFVLILLWIWSNQETEKALC